MDNKEFIIALLDKTLWPVLTLIIFLFLLKPLQALLPFLKKAKISKLELEFEKTLNSVAQEADNEFESTSGKRADLLLLAKNAPNAAVLEAWKEVEHSAERLIVKYDSNIELTSSTPYKLLQELMIEKGLISIQKVKVFDDLRQLRNKVAHAHNFTLAPNQALGYIGIASKLCEYLDAEAQKLINR